jgi:hypothetical protein
MRKMVLVGVLCFAQVVQTLAHSWYPAACCSGQDCKPIRQLLVQPNGDWILYIQLTESSGLVPVMVPKDHPKQPSLDSHIHVCVGLGSDDKLFVRCVFVPGDA